MNATPNSAVCVEFFGRVRENASLRKGMLRIEL